MPVPRVEELGRLMFFHLSAFLAPTENRLSCLSQVPQKVACTTLKSA